MDRQTARHFDWKIGGLLALSLFLMSGIDTTEQKELAQLKSQRQLRAFASTIDEQPSPTKQESSSSEINLEDPNTPIFKEK